LLWSEDERTSATLPDSVARNRGDIDASTLIEASRRAQEMTVFEQRRLLRQAADTLRNRRETAVGEAASRAPYHLDCELRLMAEQILRTPRSLVRLAFWEAAQALRDLDRAMPATPLAH
jgi:hypothetical protein